MQQGRKIGNQNSCVIVILLFHEAKTEVCNCTCKQITAIFSYGLRLNFSADVKETVLFPLVLCQSGEGSNHSG